MVLLRMIGGDEIHICDSLMHCLTKDKSIGRFKRSADGSYNHVSNSITNQSRLKMMIVRGRIVNMRYLLERYFVQIDNTRTLVCVPFQNVSAFRTVQLETS